MSALVFEPLIAASILAADFARLGEEVRAVLAAGADWIHFDVMDNHYVPNLSVGPAVCEAIRPHAQGRMIDVHLMVEPVDDLVPAFARAGAGSISFHPEASRHVDRTIRLIREHGCGVGLALNPGTPLAWLDEVIGDLDVVLLMSVNPGYGGQAFIARTLDRLRRVRERIAQTERDSGHHVRLQIDGGVKTDNIAAIARAGAEVFVAGSAIFGAPHYAEVVATLKRLASAQRAVAP